VPSFSDSSGPVSSLLPEDNEWEGHNFFQEEIMVLGGTFWHAYVRLKSASLRFIRFRHWMILFWLITLHRRLFL
jgi:hypothetical protein